MQADPTNCNVYIGNISPEVEHEELRALVGSYGPMVSMRMYRKECYGFAEFESHDDAVRCILGAPLPLTISPSRLLLQQSATANPSSCCVRRVMVVVLHAVWLLFTLVLLMGHSMGANAGCLLTRMLHSWFLMVTTWCCCPTGLNGHLMGGKLLRMAWGRHQNRQAGQAGSSSGYRAAAAVPTAGMALGQMLDPATGGFMLAPGMMGAHLFVQDGSTPACSRARQEALSQSRATSSGQSFNALTG